MRKAGEIHDELIADEKKGFDFASKWEWALQYRRKINWGEYRV